MSSRQSLFFLSNISEMVLKYVLFSPGNQYDFDDDDYGAPPTLSLSNPELGTRPPEMPMLRYAVSSTELLYERAMARFYRAAEKEKNRELLRAGSEPQTLGEVQRRGSLRRKPSGAEQQKLLQMQERRLSLKLGDELELRASPIPKLITGIVLNGVVETSENLTENEIKDPEENKRFIRDHSVEEDYTESTASSDSESQDERFKLLFKKIKELDDDEEDTYHPRSMLPTNNNSQAAEVLNKLAPLPDPDFVPKPILKPQPNDKLKTPPAKPERKSLISKPLNDGLPQINVVPPEEKKEIAKPLDNVQKRKLELRQKSEEENKVVIDHYADLVRQVSTSKKQIDSNDGSNYTESMKNNNVISEQSNVVSISEIKEPLINQSTNNKNLIRRQRPLSKDRTSSADDNKRNREISKDRVNVRGREHSKDRDNLRNRGNSRDRGVSKDRTVSTRISRYEDVKHIERNRSESRSPTRRIKNKTITTNSRVRNASKTRKRSESRSPTRQKEIIYQNTPLLNERWQAKADNVSQAVAEANVRSAFAYLTDLAMFLLACWLYIFKDARLAIPILALMIYRQLGEELQKRMPQWIVKKWQK